MANLNQAFLNQGLISFAPNPPQIHWDKAPERILQFGTGSLLRGLPDYFIDQANRKGAFNGRIVVIKSTNKGSSEAFAKQDCLYSIYTSGVQAGIEVQETTLVSCISRVLVASEQWDEILEFAIQPQLEIVISNTTEVGIVFDEKDELDKFPPTSFPGKLTAILYQRFSYYKGDPCKGLIILPTELISDNGSKLKKIVLHLAEFHHLGADFVHWLNSANYFCATLVDRIVPGKPGEEEQLILEKEWGYKDDLAIVVEPYKLWAIESDVERVQESLSFLKVDASVVIVPNLWKFKELKLRLLNGAHTFSCGLAVLCGFETVKEAMKNEIFSEYVQKVMKSEIIPAIIGAELGEDEANGFAGDVMDRFSNPFLNHQWLSISLNFTTKMQMRNVFSINSFIEKYQQVPQYMALGFAAYLYFMKCEQNRDGDYIGVIGNKKYLIHDPNAELFATYWEEYNIKELVDLVLNNDSLWKLKLINLPGWADQVLYYLQALGSNECLEVINTLNNSPSNPKIAS